MDESLLSYYNRELAYLRGQGAEFAEKHPKIAGRLRLDKDIVEDPHVSRLIESFAFLTARIRHKLDDEYPELTEALMGTLFPDYHAPIPSMSIVQFSPIPERAEFHHVAAGTMLYSEANPEGTCYFSTCYDTQAFPVSIDRAEFRAQPFEAPPHPGGNRNGEASQGLLRVALSAQGGTTLAQTAPGRLRFYINGQPQVAFRLYEYLLRQTSGVSIARSPRDPDAVGLDRTCLQAVGLEASHRVLPMDGRSSAAHRLLTEYFAFPQKFLFIELTVPPEAWNAFDDKANIYVYFDSSDPELIQGVGAETLLLGATPAINLFRHASEAVSAAELGYETRVTVDTTNAGCADIHSLLNVQAVDSDGQQLTLQPFYGADCQAGDETPGIYWHARREISGWHNGRASRGMDTYLSFVDADSRMASPDSDWIIYADALCTNRDLPDGLPFGPQQPQLAFLEGGAGLRIRCVTAPTRPVLPRLDDATRWQLITQLSLQQFGSEDGLDVLQRTLRLYDFGQTRENAAVIDGITELRMEPATTRVPRQGRIGVCQGTRIHLTVDEHRYSGSGVYLFSAILSEFFAQYCALNTFVQLIVSSKQRPESVIEWPPKSGKQNLL